MVSIGQTAPDATAAFTALHTPAGRRVLAIADAESAADPLKAATRLRRDAEQANSPAPRTACSSAG